MFRPAHRDRATLQAPFDAAVVIPTILRPSLLRAVRSVFQQDLSGRVQILIGIDAYEGDPAILDQLEAECPAHMAITVMDPGYSTSVRHGGLYPNRFSGAIRTLLTFAANSPHVAYLDDDNWWAPNHLSSLKAALADADWAWSQRWYVEPGTEEPICIDEWESVGPDAGLFKDKFGGFVDPSSLMIDKMACHDMVPVWSLAAFPDGGGEDRLVFATLKQHYRGKPTGQPSSFYLISPGDINHAARLQIFQAHGIELPSERQQAGMRLADALADLPPLPPAGPAPASPVSHLVGELLSRLKPRDLVVLAAGDGSGALALAQAAAHTGVTPHLLAADERWNAETHAAAALRLAPAGAEARVLPPDLGPAGEWLAARGVGLDLVKIGRIDDPLKLAELAGSAWPMIRPGGVLVGEGCVATNPGIKQTVAAMADSLGLQFLAPEVPGIEDWVIQKV